MSSDRPPEQDRPDESEGDEAPVAGDEAPVAGDEAPVTPTALSPEGEPPEGPPEEPGGGGWAVGPPEARWQMDQSPAAPSGQPEDEPQRRIWDPTLGRWVQSGDAAESAATTALEAPRRGAPAPRRPAERPPRIGLGLTAVVAGLVGAVLGVVAMLFVPGPVQRREQPTATLRSVPEPTQAAERLDPVELARAARAWVVNVAVSGTVAGPVGSREFTRFGSGVVIRPGGVIATTARIVEDATKVTITLPYGRTLEAEIVGADLLSDVAVLRVPDVELPAAVLGTAELVDLADPVVAVAAPAGIQPVVVTGSVSAVGRTVDAGDGLVLFDLLQITGPIAMGGGGGVVMGGGGSAIGLTSSLAESSGNAGYAVPIDVVRAVSDQLLEDGKAAHPWLGLVVQPLDEESALRADTRGLVVVRVFEGPASRTVQAGDIIVSIDGRSVEGPMTLLKRLLEREVSDDMKLRVLRGAERVDVTVTVGEQPRP